MRSRVRGAALALRLIHPEGDQSEVGNGVY